jgi:hypothetical protein
MSAGPWLSSFLGAGLGFLAAFPLVGSMTGSASHDAPGIILFVGTLLAGPGAIAGAIIGVARERSKRTPVEAIDRGAADAGE